MEVKCEYCGSLIPDDADKCPNCGATNVNMQRSVDGTPKTIAELEQWYSDRHLPPYEVTRFFIGIDCKEPKAFGIYQDGDQYIVYKNKSDGERAVRYHGKDEDYAVNEIYLKLKEEILKQKAHNITKKNDYRHMEMPKGNHFQTSKTTPNMTRRPRRGFFSGKKIILFVIIAFILVCIGFALFSKEEATYYSYNNTPYMFYNGNYYSWDNDADQYQWIDDEEVPDSLFQNSNTYQVDRDEDDAYYYQAPENSGSSYSGNDSYYSWSDNDDWDNSWFDWSDDNDYDWGSNDSWDNDWGGYDSWDNDWGGYDSWDSDW